MKIFFSYGHDDKTEFVKKIKNDLAERGFNVWIDSLELKVKDDWEIKLEEGIIDADEIVYFITPHSARRPDGYCLNELAFAVANGKKITPVMLEYITPPLSICRIQYLDIQHLIKDYSDSEYASFLDNLIDILKSQKELSCKGDYVNSLQSILNPIDFSLDFKKHLKHFVGREWLYDKIDELLINSDQQLLWITAEAGFGKSAFSAFLAHNHQDIVGVHFCTHDNNLRKSAKNVLTNLIFQLSTQIQEYNIKLLEIKDFKDKINQYSSQEILDEFILSPLSTIDSHNNIFFVIDGLDESEAEGVNELANLLPKFNQLPNWIKIVVTSRPEPYLKIKLSKFKMIELKGNNHNNLKDLKDYLNSYKLKIKSLNEEKIDSLVTKSEGNILYLKEIISSLFNGELSIEDIDNLPKGMYSLYNKMFERYFSDVHQYKELQRPLFELMSASYEPIHIDDVLNILEWDDYDLDNSLEAIGSLIVNNNTLSFFHKSLIDWLTNRESAGRSFFVSQKKGHEKIVNYFLNNFDLKSNQINKYFIKYLPNHFIVLNMHQHLCLFFQNEFAFEERINILSLDTAIRSLLIFLNVVKEEDSDLLVELYKSNAFLNNFTEYRRYFYNSGIYLDLKSIDFDEFLKKSSLTFSKDTLISIIFYYYITEDFETTIEKINTLIPIIDKNSDVYPEIINILGLSHRKLVNFDLAEQYFVEAKYLSFNVNNIFEESIASVNIAKINYHNLEFEKAININLEGIELLKISVSQLENENKIKSERLFLAEYYRLHAELLLWKNDLNEAKTYLDKGKEIYSELNIYDRYYVRWEYTSIFYNILIQNYQYCFDNYERTLKLSKNMYDKAQINFLYALNLFLSDVNGSKCDNIDLSIAVLGNAIDNNKSIKAYLELEENLILKQYIENYYDNNKFEFINYTNDNAYIEKWVNYIQKIIFKRKEV